MKNAAYVEGADGTVVLTDHSGGSDRRELYRKAADIAPGNYGSTEEYTLALRRRGEELLASRTPATSVSAECDANALPVYGEDYRIGDICDVADDGLGLSYSLRLTAVDTVWEDGAKTVYPVFGEQRALGVMIGEMVNGK